MATQTVSDRLIPQIQRVTPSTGGTVNINSNGYVILLVEPASSLLALTMNFPSNPQDGDRIEMCCSQAITSFTMSGASLLGTALATLGPFAATYVFSNDSGNWFKIG